METLQYSDDFRTQSQKSNNCRDHLAHNMTKHN